MTHSTIQTLYRLQPEDLAGQRVEVTITNVSIEGLESLTPVLHFDQLKKPMVLDPGNANDLARITQSAVMEEWIGQSVSIAPIETEQGARLALFSPTQRTLDQPLSRPAHIDSRVRQWRTVLYALLIGLIFLFVFFFERSGNALEWLQSLLPLN